jgi:hypothetical protein
MFRYREKIHCREANGTVDVHKTMLKRVNIFLVCLLRYIHTNSKYISKKNGRNKKKWHTVRRVIKDEPSLKKN